MLQKIKSSIGKILRKLISHTTPKEQNLITFIPHGGCEIDKYNFINYKSDSALTLFNYIVNKYGDKYNYQISSGDSEISKLQLMVNQAYPNINIRIIGHPNITDNNWEVCKSLSKSKYIFTSQALYLDYISNKQEFYYLGYYSGNFKNDIVDKYDKKKNYYNKYKAFFSPSLLFSQINSLVYRASLSKFVICGLVRNDNLLLDYNCPELDKWVKDSVDYEIKMIFLYTPTHRDYEETSHENRSVLGFDINKEELGNFLRENNIVIIIKNHSHQNLKVIEKTLPEGILIHQPTSDYGLNELLQKADVLITDYTSTYFDYLLLNRPVLFNFYDYDKYKDTRGFSFDPLKPILAGEIFSDQDSMIEKIKLILKKDRFAKERELIKDLFFKYPDSLSCERVYRFVFERDLNE